MKDRSLLDRYFRGFLLGLMIVHGGFIGASAQFFQGLEAQIGIEAPRSFQVRGKINFPDNWFGVMGFGFAPRFMTDAYGSMASGLGIHGDNTAKLVAAGMGNNFSMDLRVGYEFGGNENGFYLDFGYGLIAGKGSDTSMDILEGALNEDFVGVPQSAVPVVGSTVHSLVAHLGYATRLSNSLITSFEIGLIKALSSSNEVTFRSNSGVTSYAQDMIDKDVDSYLKGVYQDEMISPTLSVWVSYLF